MKPASIIAWLIFALSLPSIFYCGGWFILWAWITATPVTPEQLAHAQHQAQLWLGLTGLSFLTAFTSLVAALLLPRRKM